MALHIWKHVPLHYAWYHAITHRSLGRVIMGVVLPKVWSYHSSLLWVENNTVLLQSHSWQYITRIKNNKNRTTVELCLSDTPQQWTPTNIMKVPTVLTFTSILNWTADTPLLCVTDSFCTPNCTQYWFSGHSSTFSARLSTIIAGVNNLTLD